MLLPGMHGSGILFSALMDRIPETWNSAVISYPNDVILSYAELLQWFRSRVPTTEEYFLLAESFSTPLAIQFAATHPRNMQGLILCAGFASSPLKGWRRSLMKCIAPLCLGLAVPAFVLQRLAGENAPPELLPLVRSAISEVEPEVFAARMLAVLSCDAREELSRIRVPVLYLLAQRDRVVPRACFEEIRRIRPEVNLAEIDAPHLLLQCQPQPAADAVTDFIGRLESTQINSEN